MVQQYLDAYLDQALGEEQMATIEEHLAECDACFSLLAERQEPLDDLEDPMLQRMVLAEPPSLSPDFTAQVMQRVEAEQPAKVRSIRPWLWKNWTRRRYSSVAYAMSATMVVVSAGNLLFLWNKSTDRLAVWAAQGQAYWEALQAYVGPALNWLLDVWQALTALQ